MAGLLALAGESPFRARAYERAATAIEHLDIDLAALVEAGRLTELPGIGRGHRGDDRGAAPDGPLQRAGRPARAHAAGRAFARPDPGPRARQDQGTSCRARRRDHRRAQDGLRRGTACAVSRAWGRRRSGASSSGSAPSTIRLTSGCRLDRALALAESFTAHLRAAPGVVRAETAGALRRRAETVDRLVFVAAAPTPGPVIGHALASPLVASISGRATGNCSAVLADGVPIELRVVEPDRYAGALLDATGSADHLRGLARVARARGLELGAEGLASTPSGARVPAAGEEDLYRHLGLPYIPPELREGSGEVEAAAGRAPARRPRQPPAICGASSTATRSTPTASTPSRRWRAPRTPWACGI